MQLKSHHDYKRVYLRSSKTFSDRNQEQNYRLILENTDLGEQFRLTANGKIVSKTVNKLPRFQQNRINRSQAENNPDPNHVLHQALNDADLISRLSDISDTQNRRVSSPHNPGAVGRSTSFIGVENYFYNNSVHQDDQADLSHL